MKADISIATFICPGKTTTSSDGGSKKLYLCLDCLSERSEEPVFYKLSN